MSIDAIGDFLTIIRNGINVSRRTVSAPHSSIKEQIAEILKNEGFIQDFEIIDEDNNKKSLTVSLKYVRGESVIHEITRVSTPSWRIYQGADELRHIKGKIGISIVTTNQGIMTDKQARESRVGGEVICSVW